MTVQIGDMIRIESYKHGNHLHRIWKTSTVLNNGEPLIVANEWPEVIENDGQQRSYPGLSVCVFNKKQWFHTIILYDDQNRWKGFYIHLASPYDLKQSTLTYIDYDLDLIVDTSYNYYWVDEQEYEQHAQIYQYPKQVDQIIRETQVKVEQLIEDKQDPFTLTFAKLWCHQYCSLKEEIDDTSNSKKTKFKKDRD